MQQFCQYGSVRGATGNRRPYRDNYYTQEKGIAAIPVSVFYREPPAHNVLRFCFAKSEQTLAQGAEILSSL